MAFPTGYAKYQEITIDHTKVAGDLTDYVVYVNLANLVKAGADIFDTCRTDGGDLRATKTDGTTELAIEIVAIDTTAKTGEVHIKFTGTLSSSTDTVIRLWYNGTDTLPAVTDTYGRNAVWGGYIAVYHLQTSSVDSTGNHSGTDTSITYSAGNGKIGQGAGLTIASLSKIALSTSTALRATTFTYTTWINPVDFTNTASLNGQDPGGINYKAWFLLTSQKQTMHKEGVAVLGTSTTSLTAGVWQKATVKYDGSNITFYLNGSADGTASSTQTFSYGTMVLGARGGTANHLKGALDEYRISGVMVANTWETTEYNNQSSPSTFYATGDELGGSTIVSPSAQVATFTVPAYTIIRGVVLQATVQTATFSLPGDTVLTSVRVSPIAQTATFTIPAYGISASAVVFGASVQVSTFTVPAYTVLRGSVFSPDAQTLTFTVPSPAIATGNTVSVEPVVLTFTIPALAFIGALWRRSGRSSANWTRSPINND